MSIQIEHLNYVYDPKSPFANRALDDVSLTIEDGDFFGIIGHTGSGKSTLVSHLNALIRVQTKLNPGCVLRVSGIDLAAKKPDLKALRERVGMVFQYPEYQLFADSVRDDVAYGPRNLGLSAEETDVRVREAVRLVGLDYDEIAERSPFELSGGQKRRVAVAGVIAMRPEVLIMDEPTAGLDPRGKHEILALVREIKKSCPTIIMVSHNMDEIAECCNKVAVLGEGKIMGVFTPAELFSRRELIHSLGLELPTVTECAAFLAERIPGVRPDTLTEEELLDELTTAARRGA